MDMSGFKVVGNNADAIIDYLKSIETLGNEEGPQQGPETEPCDPHKDITDIMKEILQDVEATIALKDVYDHVNEKHNQRSCFKLSCLVPDFELDKDVFNAMVFHENLIISKLVRRQHGRQEAYNLDPVGALCLDVQAAEGRHLVNSFELNAEKLDANIEEKVQKVKSALRNDPILDEQYENYLKTEIETYEKSLKESMKHNNEKFLVHLSSQFEYNRKNAGSRITAWVDHKLHTLEEKRTEFAYNTEQQYIERVVHVAQEKKMYNIKAKFEAGNILRVRKHPFSETRDLVCEGSNFLLLRFLALAKFIGTIELSTVYIDGSLCRNIYECSGPSKGIVNDTNLDVTKIYRTIIENCGIVHKCATVLTLQGQILKQEWENSDYVLHLNPVSRVQNQKPTGHDDIITKKVWKKDLQLLSQYLDIQTETTLLIKAYLRDHVEVMDMVADYVQHALQMKPDDVEGFTIEYFQSFLPIHLPRGTSHDDEDDHFFL